MTANTILTLIWRSILARNLTAMRFSYLPETISMSHNCMIDDVTGNGHIHLDFVYIKLRIRELFVYS
jgi:hypothetical protein